MIKQYDIFLCIAGPTSGTAVTLKTGRREVSGSNPGRACRPSLSEVSVFFLRNSRKYGLGSVRKDPLRKEFPYRSRSPIQTIRLNPTTQNNPLFVCFVLFCNEIKLTICISVLVSKDKTY